MRRRAVLVGGAFVAITAVHAAVGRETHALHLVHVAFGALYLLPVVAAATWLGPRSGVALAVASAVAYAIHARTAWAGDPMENANQLAMAVVYLFVGGVAAALVSAAERERRTRLDAERTAQRAALVQGIASLSGALRQRDDATGAHCERVARLAVRLGTAMGLARPEVEVLRLAALAHDVGKIGVRDDVLLKPGELTPDERARVERHPAIAAEILRPIRGAEEIAELVLDHHECPDGSGYPRGLAGARIPALARILRVADVFAALVEPRAYKPAMEAEEAIARMRALAGKVDAACLDVLARLVGAGAAETTPAAVPAGAPRRADEATARDGGGGAEPAPVGFPRRRTPRSEA